MATKLLSCFCELSIFLECCHIFNLIFFSPFFQSFAGLFCFFVFAPLQREPPPASLATPLFIYLFFTIFFFFFPHTFTTRSEFRATNETKRKVFRSLSKPAAGFEFQFVAAAFPARSSWDCWGHGGRSWSRDRQENKRLCGRSLAQVPGSSEPLGGEQPEFRHSPGRHSFVFVGPRSASVLQGILGSEPAVFFVVLG